MLHVLIHMADSDEPATSEALSGHMASNPVVVRRVMAGLREAGIVVSERGHGGGWRLARPPENVTLAEIHDALGAPGLFAIGHRSAAPQCLAEQAVNAALDDTFEEAERIVRIRLSAITLADIARDFAARVANHPTAGKRHSHA
jgi:Rrf2 family protein